MRDSTRRAIRSGIDVVLAVLTAAGAALVFPGVGDLIDSWTSPGSVLAAGVILGALIVFFTKVRNTLEDAGTIPAFLKAPPSPGANPTPNGSENPV